MGIHELRKGGGFGLFKLWYHFNVMCWAWRFWCLYDIHPSRTDDRGEVMNGFACCLSARTYLGLSEWLNERNGIQTKVFREIWRWIWLYAGFVMGLYWIFKVRSLKWLKWVDQLPQSRSSFSDQSGWKDPNHNFFTCWSDLNRDRQWVKIRCLVIVFRDDAFKRWYLELFWVIALAIEEEDRTGYPTACRWFRNPSARIYIVCVSLWACIVVGQRFIREYAARV